MRTARALVGLALTAVTLAVTATSVTASTQPATQAATYSVGVAEACVDGEPMIRFTNTGTGHIYANIGIAARAVAPGATFDAFWPSAHGDLYPSFEWHAYELPDPAGGIGVEFATGEVQLLDACGTFYADGVELHCAEGDGRPHVTMTNTGMMDGMVAYGPTIGQRTDLDPGEHADYNWPLAPDGTLWDSFVWEFYFWTGGMQEILGSTGEFTVAQLEDLCNPAEAPSAPRSLASTPGNRVVTLRWTAPSSNGGAAITDYLIQRSPNGTTGWVTLNDGVRTTTSYSVTGLTNGTRYYFRVFAKNSAGIGAASNVVNQIPRTVPSAPRLRAYPGSLRAKLAWTAPSSTGGAAITRYVIQRSTRATTGWTTLSSTTPPTARSFWATGLRNGVRYYFRIAGVNGAGTGTWSPVISVTPSARAGSGFYFPNCTSVRQAGAAPLLRSQPGYRTALDSDRDGIACE